MRMNKIAGTPETQRFYNETGWKERDGNSIDYHLFGVKEDGPIRVELCRLHVERIRAALSRVSTRLNFLECGCGGNPDRHLLDLCSRYTGVDFSETGLERARAAFADVAIPHEFHQGDVCALPFADNTFDAVYSAHVIYHIADPAAQAAAIAEFVRVVRPGGVVVLVVANPRPFAFPIRFIRRLVADAPLLGPLVHRVRSKPPLPYRPMPISWMRRRMARGGVVEVIGAGIPSTNFHRNITEFAGPGQLAWKGIRWMDVNHPRLSAYLGNYVVLTCRKSGKERHADA
jgi:SAM-dependent methyltransferase